VIRRVLKKFVPGGAAWMTVIAFGGFVALAQSPTPATMGSTTVPSSTEQALTQVVEQFTQAQVGFAPSVLRDLTTPEYIEVSPLGEVDPRDKMLGFYAPENKVPAPSAIVSEVNIRILGDTAVVIVKVTFTTKEADANTPEHALRETFVARQTPDGWKLASAQYTTIHLKR
jgi:hypothetical protein